MTDWKKVIHLLELKPTKNNLYKLTSIEKILRELKIITEHSKRAHAWFIHVNRRFDPDKSQFQAVSINGRGGGISANTQGVYSYCRWISFEFYTLIQEQMGVPALSSVEKMTTHKKFFEKTAIDVIRQVRGYELIENYRVEVPQPNGDINVYYLDAYEPETNIGFEIDEFHHDEPRHKKTDIDRQREIEEAIGGKVIRVNQKYFY